MSHNADAARRATRLLRWYPPAWRERYADEFVDHLEQEFADRRLDLRRSFNVARKGIVARTDDLGLSSASLIPTGQTRAALGTSFVLTAIVSVLALYFWSHVLLIWSARNYHPIPIDVTTGILTASTALLVLVLVVTVVIVLVSAVRQVIRGRRRSIAWPLVLAVCSGAFISYNVRWLPREAARYSHLFQGGFRWTQPGPAAYGLASIAKSATTPWVAMWNPGILGLPRSETVSNDLVPLAIVTFAAAISLLVRRAERPPMSERLGSATVQFLGVLTGLTLVTIVVWLIAGGPAEFPKFGEMGNIAGITYLVIFALVTVLVTRLALLARRGERRSVRNHIQILG